MKVAVVYDIPHKKYQAYIMAAVQVGDKNWALQLIDDCNAKVESIHEMVE